MDIPFSIAPLVDDLLRNQSNELHQKHSAVRNPFYAYRHMLEHTEYTRRIRIETEQHRKIRIRSNRQAFARGGIV